jgi:hypothetical protein
MRLFSVLAVPVLIGAGISMTPIPVAVADCTSTGGTTICSQGESRGANTGDGPSGSGSYLPSVCDFDDWYGCDDDWGWEIDLDADLDPGRPGGPGGPGFGNPGGPGGPNFGGGGRPGGGRR